MKIQSHQPILNYVLFDNSPHHKSQTGYVLGAIEIGKYHNQMLYTVWDKRKLSITLTLSFSE